MINTNVFFDFTDFQVRHQLLFDRVFSVGVGYVFMLHVGGTRCVTSSTDNIMKIHVRITLTVEFIRAIFFIFLFYV